MIEDVPIRAANMVQEDEVLEFFVGPRDVREEDLGIDARVDGIAYFAPRVLIAPRSLQEAAVPTDDFRFLVTRQHAERLIDQNERRIRKIGVREGKRHRRARKNPQDV